MSAPERLTDRDIRFIAAMIKHNPPGFKPNLDAVATELGITINSARTYKGPISKKLFAYLDSITSSPTGVRKRSTPTTKRSSTGVGRGGRVQKPTTSSKANDSSKKHTVILDSDDEAEDDDSEDLKDEPEVETENPFTEFKPAQPAESIETVKTELTPTPGDIEMIEQIVGIENPFVESQPAQPVQLAQSAQPTGTIFPEPTPTPTPDNIEPVTQIDAHDLPQSIAQDYPFTSIETSYTMMTEEEEDAQLREAYGDDAFDYTTYGNDHN